MQTTEYEAAELFNGETVAHDSGIEEYVHLKSCEDEYEHLESTLPDKARANMPEQQHHYSSNEQGSDENETAVEVYDPEQQCAAETGSYGAGYPCYDEHAKFADQQYWTNEQHHGEGTSIYGYSDEGDGGDDDGQSVLFTDGNAEHEVTAHAECDDNDDASDSHCQQQAEPLSLEIPALNSKQLATEQLPAAPRSPIG